MDFYFRGFLPFPSEGALGSVLIKPDWFVGWASGFVGMGPACGVAFHIIIRRTHEHHVIYPPRTQAAISVNFRIIGSNK